jgi:predicted PurR-regulated permease PerM
MERRILLWSLVGLAALFLLYLVGHVVMPFVAGAALAYILDPLVDRIERLGVGRFVATTLVVVLAGLIFALAFVLVAPVVFGQIANFATQLPSYVSRLLNLATEQGGPLVERIGGADALAQAQRSIGDLVGQGSSYLASFARSVWSGSKALFGVLSIAVITPVVAFYLLVDWNRMVATIDDLVPPRHRATVRRLGREMDHAVYGYVWGQSLLCLILGSFYAAGLTLIGLNFGALIGMVAGLISFIPYVGSLTGLVLSVGVALVQFLPDWTLVIVTFAIFAIGQFIEGNILSPKLVGASAGVHPVWVMFALVAFGSLFGFIGLLLAVPLAAIIAVLVRFGFTQYRESTIYTGAPRVFPVERERGLAGSEMDG